MSRRRHATVYLPSRRAILVWFALGNFALLLSLLVDQPHQALQTVCWAALTAVGVIQLIDWFLSRQQPPVRIQREVSSGLALNRWSEATLTIEHPFNSNTTIELFDHLPEFTDTQGAQTSVPLQPNRVSTRQYRLRPLRRGPLDLQHCQVRIPSPLGLWIVQYKTPCTSHSKIYPDFASVAAYTILAAENHANQLGIRRKNRRGQGLDFHQLRDYRQGDSLRQLDWKATARRQELISKDYQDERDQNVIIMIDSGRRMRSKDGELDHFDHALNASLLISYIALRQGDSVGVLSFGHSERWIAPQKGSDRVNVILNGLYDLQTSNRAPDYLAAAEKLARLQQKRSLVILVTNTRDEELDELALALDLLRKRHIVLIANVRESSLDRATQTPVASFEHAMEYCGAIDFAQQKRHLTNLLNSKGLITLDCLAAELPVKIANSYWDIKRAGAL